MLEAFLNFIQNKNLATYDKKIIVAVSGGLDSVVLLHLLANTSYEIAIAHCNFHLRGEESDSEEEFVRSLANKYQVPCFVKSFNTEQHATENNLSIQIAARELRYRWFDELLENEKYHLIATAHHLNDSIETIFYNLVKGTGLAGLRGIPVKNKNIIRPLLFATRDQVERFAEKENLKWKEDSSNKSDKYSRNFIRHNVIPLLKEINPSLEETFSNNIDRFLQTEAFFQYALDNIKKDLLVFKDNDIWINRRYLDSLPGRNIVLASILEPYGFNYSQVLDIVNPHQAGKIYYADNYLLNVDRSYYLISPISTYEQGIIDIDEATPEIKTAQFSLKMENKLKDNPFKIITSKDVAQLDADQLRFPLKLRPWEKGDKFQPLGMKGKKKLSDYMIDEKIPVNLKSRIYVLANNTGEIIWVVGHRIDNRFKVNTDTKNILTITKTAGND